MAVGLDQGRLALLLAVLHRHAGIAMHDQDVFVSVVGGVRVAETAADLPVLFAALASLRDRAVPRDVAAFGEERLREAAKQGFRRVLVPAANAPRQAIDGLEVVPVSRLQDAITEMF